MTFSLQIVTPDGLRFDGEGLRVTLPTINGPVTILPRHINYVTGLGMGPCKLVTEDGARLAACIGGMLAVTDNKVKVVATTFEWAEDVDVDRAKASLEKAEEKLAAPDLEEAARQVYKARKKRALARLDVAEKYKKA